MVVSDTERLVTEANEKLKETGRPYSIMCFGEPKDVATFFTASGSLELSEVVKFISYLERKKEQLELELVEVN